ncbi:MAG: hypothetical protein LBP62_08530, partial [Clostridiales bacterium]|nr:hypothetical protein [Clostridiales bacterium]
MLKNKTVYGIDEIIPLIGRVCGGGNITAAFGADVPTDYAAVLVRKLARAGYVITERRFWGKFDGASPDFLIPIEAIRLIVGVGGEEFGEVVAASAYQKKIAAVYIPTENGLTAEKLRGKDYAVFYYDGYFMRRPLSAFDAVFFDAGLVKAAGEKSGAAGIGYGLMRVLGLFDGLFCDLVEGGSLKDGEYRAAVYRLAADCAPVNTYGNAKKSGAFGKGKVENSEAFGNCNKAAACVPENGNAASLETFGNGDTRVNAFWNGVSGMNNAFGKNSAASLNAFGNNDSGMSDNAYGNNNSGMSNNAFGKNNAASLNAFGKSDTANSDALKNGGVRRSAFGSAVYSALIYNKNNPDISVGEAAFIVSYVTIKLYRRFLDGGMPDLSIPKDYSLWTDALSKRIGTDVIKLFKDLECAGADEYLKRRHIAGEYRAELAELIRLLDDRLPAILKKFR